MTSFCDAMRVKAQAAWQAAVGHRFFREAGADTLADDIFARYLRIEYGFVDTAAAALGYAVAKAPGFRERRRLALNLHGLVTDQEQFFVAAFDRIGTPSHQRNGLAPDGLSRPLHELFLGVAKNEGYEEILACILGAEWLYLTWCGAANRTPSARPALNDWIALHAGGDFAAGVAWVRAELDTRAPALSADRQARLADLFGRTLAAEVAFHDAAYET